MNAAFANFPNTLEDLSTLCANKHALVTTLLQLDLLENQPPCESCVPARVMVLHQEKRLADGYIWRCTVCRKSKSIREGSWFPSGGLPIATILKLALLFTRGFQVKDVC